MAKITQYKATPLVAAMSQKASQLLGGQNMAIAPGGGAVPQPAAAQYPSTFRDQRASQLQGNVRMSQAMNQALMQPTMKAASRAEIYAAAASRAAAADMAQRQSYGGDMFSQSDFERGNLEFAGQLGMTGEDALAAAARHAPSYGGAQFTPHNIAQEGHVEYRNGVPGIWIKYSSPGQGSSTEWTPLS